MLCDANDGHASDRQIKLQGIVAICIDNNDARLNVLSQVIWREPAPEAHLSISIYKGFRRGRSLMLCEANDGHTSDRQIKL